MNIFELAGRGGRWGVNEIDKTESFQGDMETLQKAFRVIAENAERVSLAMQELLLIAEEIKIKRILRRLTP